MKVVCKLVGSSPTNLSQCCGTFAERTSVSGGIRPKWTVEKEAFAVFGVTDGIGHTLMKWFARGLHCMIVCLQGNCVKFLRVQWRAMSISM